MPLVGLGVMILFARLVRVQPGLDAGAIGEPLRRGGRGDACSAAAGGVIGAFVMTQISTRRSTSAWSATARSPASWRSPLRRATSRRGRRRSSASSPADRGLGVIAIDKLLDDPVGALSAHGLAGIWGTLSCGLFTSPRLAQYNAFGDPDGGLFYSGASRSWSLRRSAWWSAFSFVFVDELR